ncbi:MAG: trigger factor [Clostridia bacterium]|nr:trigger factor [Clostridia bacterium]
MNLKKLLITALALIMAFSLASCQLSEYIDEGPQTNAVSDTKDADTDATAANPDAKPEDYIPEGVDISYQMDYMSEDLTKYITLGQYKGFESEIATYAVDDEYLNERIEKLLEDNAVETKITDRKTAEGDKIYVDYVGTLDGVAFNGGSAQNVEISLTSNSGYIPGFTDGMYDVMPGETVSYEVTFPENYHAANLAGKLTVFTVTVHYIVGDPVAPELNDAFVSEKYGSEGCNTVEEFKVYYKAQLEDERKEQIKDDLAEDVWGMIMEDVTVIELPQDAINSLYWLNRANYEAYAAQQGMSYEEFLAAYVGQTDEQLLQYAENYIKEDIVIYSIVKAENLEITEDERAEEIAKFCVQYEMTEKELIEAYGEDRIMSVIQWNKLMKALCEWNTAIEVIG